ncbi:MAG: hypothetical protein A2W33_01575 [Chloroflexi bacterium RBG_16_52_11]|nr:MAG: hypothetical protein A2W33_01575 [Chloroflexi bacterium RBG_16_52_11]
MHATFKWVGLVNRFWEQVLRLTGLSSLVYNQISKKYEIPAEKFSYNESEPSVYGLPLIHDSQQIAWLYFHMFPDVFNPPAQTDMLQSLAPEIALAFERIDLMRSQTEITQAIQKKEQDHIARHLHDTIGHDLAYLCLKLDQLSSTGHQNGSASFQSEIKYLHSVANNAYEQIRNLLSELQDEQHDPSSTDLVSHVKESALLIGARANFQVNLRTVGNPIILPPQLQRQILYLVREALRNVEKHANAQNVTLAFNWIDNGLTIKLWDDGQGFDVSVKQKNGGHYGLRIIQEIVDELNGSLSVESSQNEGTQITLWLPFN